jgi:hypothetical protein
MEAIEQADRTREFFEQAPCANSYGEVDGRLVFSTHQQRRALAGTDIDAVGSYDERLACPICHNPAFGGVMTKKCAHHFHKVCLDRAIKSNPNCPVCRTAVGEGEYADLADVQGARYLRQSINELKVDCPMGCGAHVKWESLGGHVRDSCTKTVVFCKHPRCRTTACRNTIAGHEEVCGKGVVLCKCGESMPREAQKQHCDTACPAHPISCKHCGAQDVLRGEMEAHLDNCKGAVPMSEVRKLIDRINTLEQEGKRQRTT